MQGAERAVDLDVPVVAGRLEPGQPVGLQQAAEPGAVRGAARACPRRRRCSRPTAWRCRSAQPPQLGEHVLVETRRARSWMMPRAMKKSSAQTTGSNAPSARTHISGGVRDVLLLELERGAVVDVVADVLLVGQHLVDGAAGPRPAEVGQQPCGR